MYYVDFLCTFSLIFVNFYVEVFVCVFKKKKKKIFYPNVTLFSNVSVISGNAEHDRLVYSSNLNR